MLAAFPQPPSTPAAAPSDTPDLEPASSKIDASRSWWPDEPQQPPTEDVNAASAAEVQQPPTEDVNAASAASTPRKKNNMPRGSMGE